MNAKLTMTSRLRQALPPVAVFVTLALVAWWGHRTNWRFLLAAPAPVSAASLEVRPAWEDWNNRWCEKHFIADCPLCRPERRQTADTSPPDDADAERLTRALAAKPREINTSPPSMLASALEFASAEAVAQAGVNVAPVLRDEIVEALTISAEVAFDPTREAHLTSRLPGHAWRVFRRTGDAVQAGEVLAIIDASAVGKAKAELLQALVQTRLRQRAVDKLGNSPVSERQKKEAEAALRAAQTRTRSAEQALINLGLPVRSEELRTLLPAQAAQRLQRLGLPDELTGAEENLSENLLPIRSPLDGVVLQSHAVAGEVVDTQDVLFTIVDPRQVWLNMHIPSGQAGWLKPGQEVRFAPDGVSQEVRSQLAWIGNKADPNTRTVTARATLDNDSGELRASMLGQARIVLRQEPEAIVVPTAAIHEHAGHSIVFVRDRDFLQPHGPARFHTRVVRIGAVNGDRTEILVGVWPDEAVATAGSSLLLNLAHEGAPDRAARRGHSTRQR